MKWLLSLRSKRNLEQVHSHLARVVRRALEISEVDFVVIEGMRTLERQKDLVASGASKTMNSRHLTGHAVDVVPLLDGKVSWRWALFDKVAEAMKIAAAQENVPIEWGGDWTTFKDGPHFQLPRDRYPG